MGCIFSSSAESASTVGRVEAFQGQTLIGGFQVEDQPAVVGSPQARWSSSSPVTDDRLKRRKSTRASTKSFLAMLLNARRLPNQLVKIDVQNSKLEPSNNSQQTAHNASQVAKRRRSSNKVLASPDEHLKVPSGEKSSEMQKSKARSSPTTSFDSSHRSHKLDKQSLADDNHQDEPRLFTSISQLCREIVQQSILSQIPDETGGKVLCLFVFGRQGSSKGEIAFDLVHHSALLKRLHPELVRSEQNESHKCPLYYHIDVAAIIVANIDDRIKEYNRLVSESLRCKRQQETQVADLSEEKDEQEAAAGGEDDASNSFEAEQEAKTESRSVSSELSSSNSNLAETRTSLMSDDFGLITLSTKQRSMLQLKLLKYYNSVTSKWIFELICEQVEKVEAQLREALRVGPSTICAPSRVYLINLVPEQMSIFKSCVYLKQSLHLKNFKFPFFAINFERRTNIKLMSKERAVNSSSSSSERKESSSSSSILTGMRLPMLRLSLHVADANGKEESSKPEKENEQESSSLSRNLSLLNEKLKPKFSENFVSQFSLMNKLAEVRFNPSFNYNYKDQDRIAADNCDDLLELHPSSMSQLRVASQASLLSADSLLPSASSTPSSVSASDNWQQSRHSQSAIKWAVEVELCDSSASRAAEQLDEASLRVSHLLESPIIYKDPKCANHRSHHSNQQPADEQYRLEPVRVGYANEQSQLFYQVKRLHPRLLKLKSGAKLDRLAKSVERARSQLANDCDNWLFDAVQRRHQLLATSGGSNQLHRRHSARSTCDLQPSMIVYTIRLDVSRLRSAVSSRSLTAPTPVEDQSRLVPILVLASDEQTHSERATRRVQFKLSEAPRTSQDVEQRKWSLRVQRRRWLDSTLFVSAEQSAESVLQQVSDWLLEQLSAPTS